MAQLFSLDDFSRYEKIRAIFFARASGAAVVSPAEHISRRVSLSDDTGEPHFEQFRLGVLVLRRFVF